MKKIVSIFLLIMFLFFTMFFASVNATEDTVKSLEYTVVIKNINGVILKGIYKDTNNTEKNIEVTIPQDTKVKVLYEYLKDGVLLGHVKYSTTITVRSDGTVLDSTSGYKPSYRGTSGDGTGYYNYYSSSFYGVGNTDLIEQIDPIEMPDTSNISQEGGNYNDMPDTTSKEGGNYNNQQDTINQTNESGSYNNAPDTSSTTNNTLDTSINSSNNSIDLYPKTNVDNSYSEMTAGTGLDTSGGESDRYIETKKTIEIEGDIDLSQCEVEKEYYLSDAINYKTKRKIMVVNKDGIDLYNGPARAYGKAETTIPANTLLKYEYGAVPLDKANKNTMWAYVQYNDKKGWIYIHPLDSLVATFEQGRALSFKSVTIKEYPLSDSKTVDTLSKDSRHSFTYVYGIQDINNDEWYYIEYNGKKGWIKEVAKGVNAKIKVNSENGIKVYRLPSLDAQTYDILLPNKLELSSIYKYSKKSDAFYIEYEGYNGWIILEKYKDDSYNFEITYLDDDITDPLLDIEEKEIIKEDTKNIKKKQPRYKKIILMTAGISMLIGTIIFSIVKIRNR